MINYFTEELEFELQQADSVSRWISQVVGDESKGLSSLTYIFCTDDYLLSINKQHLDHDFYTDVITFDYSDGSPTLSGDIFISIDRVKDNAKQLSETFNNELHRVMVHGVLHLCGYKDKTEGEEKEMRMKEDHYLSLRAFLE